MKTAEEYIREFQDSTHHSKTLGKIALAMLGEIAELVRVRHIQTDEALFLIVGEIEKKWKLFSKPFPGVSGNGFMLLLREKMPEIYVAVMAYRRKVQSWRKIPDREIIKELSGILHNSGIAAGASRKALDVINKCCLLYCRIVGLGVVEFQKK